MRRLRVLSIAVKALREITLTLEKLLLDGNPGQSFWFLLAKHLPWSE
jgi:hypothetical protein